MKFTTIWTLPGLPLRERFNRTGELWMMKVAHWLPRRLAYWSLIDSGVRYMGGDDVIPEVPFTTVLQRAGDELKEAHR